MLFRRDESGMGQREKVDCMQLQLMPREALEQRGVLYTGNPNPDKGVGLCIFNTNHHRGRDIPGAGIKVPVK